MRSRFGDRRAYTADQVGSRARGPHDAQVLRAAGFVQRARQVARVQFGVVERQGVEALANAAGASLRASVRLAAGSRRERRVVIDAPRAAYPWRLRVWSVGGRPQVRKKACSAEKPGPMAVMTPNSPLGSSGQRRRKRSSTNSTLTLDMFP